MTGIRWTLTLSFLFSGTIATAFGQIGLNSAWYIDTVNGDHDTGGCTTPAAVAGYPHITVPAGLVFGLPVGISFVGKAYSEPVLFRLAFAYEQATKFRTPPRFLPSVDLSSRI